MKLKGCGNPINKRAFRRRVWRKLKTEYKGHELTQEQVYWAVTAVLDCLVDIIRNGEYLQLIGYFSMFANFKKPKVCNGFNRLKYEVPAHYSVKFVPHSLFKDACEELLDHEKEESQMDEG